MKKNSFILLIAVMLLAACTAGRGSKETPSLEGTSWTLVKFKGNDVLTTTKVWINFNGAEITGNGGCNHYGGVVTKDTNGNMEIGMIFMTEMYCMEDGVSDQEYEYLQVLDQVVSYYVSGENLFMESSESDVVLEFAQQEVIKE